MGMMFEYSRFTPRRPTTTRGFDKAAWGERARVSEMFAREEARVRRAFRTFLDDARDPSVRRYLMQAGLTRGGAADMLRVVDARVARMGSAVTQGFQSVGHAEITVLGRKLGDPAVGLFDPTSSRAADIMRRSRAEFVDGLARAQRESLQAVLAETTDLGPVQTARALRDTVGLGERQLRAVDNYRRLLEASDKEALGRVLRDRRFDSTVRRAAEGGEPLGADKIDRMVAQYRSKLLQHRVKTIARTEAHRIVGRARREAMQQALEQSGIPKRSVRRIWNITGDGRERDTHDEMSGQSVGVDEPFVSPGGALFMFPGDTSLGAEAEELVNCRCWETYEFAEDDAPSSTD